MSAHAGPDRSEPPTAMDMGFATEEEICNNDNLTLKFHPKVGLPEK